VKTDFIPEEMLPILNEISRLGRMRGVSLVNTKVVWRSRTVQAGCLAAYFKMFAR